MVGQTVQKIGLHAAETILRAPVLDLTKLVSRNSGKNNFKTIINIDGMSL